LGGRKGIWPVKSPVPTTEQVNFWEPSLTRDKSGKTGQLSKKIKVAVVVVTAVLYNN